MIGRSLLDLFDKYAPLGSTILDHIRRTRIDVHTIVCLLKPFPTDKSKVKWLNIEVTNICNSNCRFCAYRYQDKFRRSRGIMVDAIFEKAVNDFKKCGGKFVSLTPFAGEPLLDPSIIDRTEFIKKSGLWAGFFTNGTFLNRIDIDRLLKSGIDALAISTAPLERGMYELVYQNKHYEDLLNGLKNLFVARNSLRKDLIVSLTFRSHIPMKEVLSLPDFQKSIYPLLTMEDRKAIIVNTRGFDTWGGQITEKDMVGNMRLALPPLIKRRPCAWTFNLYLTWDGQVRACACRFAEAENEDGKDDLYLGNIMESSLTEIWLGSEIKRLRSSFREGNLPLVCRNCTMYRPC
jgi:MoaA/NifB/PqqE/SkfB family radical SAM enzyme